MTDHASCLGTTLLRLGMRLGNLLAPIPPAAFILCKKLRHCGLPHRTRISIPTIFLSVGLVATCFTSLAKAQTSSGFSPDGNPLLLVHGYTDSCNAAFNSIDKVPNTGLNATPTVDYLQHHGWPSQALDQIGYYSNDSNCTNNLQDFNPDTNSQTDGTVWEHCKALLSNPIGSAIHTDWAGTSNDPIEHLGCLLAWYIHLKYGSQPVDILAHSMGGLIVRIAIAESGQGTSTFPPSPLTIHTVVTVGTPHGGVWGAYMDLAREAGNPQELSDMDPGSHLMDLLRTWPQNGFGAYWALIASSIPGSISLRGADLVSFAAEHDPGNRNRPFPDGDGVVQADSALAMPADLKILYGAGFDNGTAFHSGGLQYSHEANTCTPPIIIGGRSFGSLCLAQPFYLNDGTDGYTKGWICNSGCNRGSPGPQGGGVADMQVSQSSRPVLDSLAEIVAIYQSRAGFPPVAGPPGYTFCSLEGGTCGFSGTASVAYGAHGAFFYRTFTNTTPCNNDIFGDPAPGAIKDCFYQIHNPPPAAPFSDAEGWAQPQYGTTIMFGDINGDHIADVCGRGGVGIECLLGTGGTFGGDHLATADFSDAQGWNQLAYYGSLRLADVTGVGRAAVCGRGGAGIWCSAANPGGTFAPKQLWTTAFSDAEGWAQPQYGTTIMFGDINGDHLADVCGRAGAGIECLLSTGGGFVSDQLATSDFSDAQGWNQLIYYGSLRLADVNGDGIADVCGRGGAGIYCALGRGDGTFEPMQLWSADYSNQNGWGQPQYATTMMFADLDGDGKADVCGRAAAGLWCALSTGGGFAPGFFATSAFSDSEGWSQLVYYGSIRLADINGDGTIQACGRSEWGIQCVSLQLPAKGGCPHCK